MSLEQIIADWLRRAWLREHPEQPLSPDSAWALQAARDLAVLIRNAYDLKRRAAAPRG